MRQFDFNGEVIVAARGTGPTLAYARWLFERLGVRVVDPDDSAAEGRPLIVTGERARGGAGPGIATTRRRHPIVIRLWDFHVGTPGTGAQASAVSGASWVIGLPDHAPLCLPASIPEKWCGAFGASFALSHDVERRTFPGAVPPQRQVEISAAEIVRCFAEQIFGNHRMFPESWRRNGRISPGHGGIYPQGFFRCRDGYVAVIGRSQHDWATMLAALGDPAWATEEFRNPFDLAHHPDKVDPLFCAELERRTRDELLALALKTGATFAPVYERAEIRAEHIVRDAFFEADGSEGLPFEILAGAAEAK